MATAIHQELKSKVDLSRWLPVLGEHLQIVEFERPADFFPYAGRAWGVLADANAKVLYPYAGCTVFFEETDECHEVFDRFRQKLADSPSITSIGTLVGTIDATTHSCHGKDGLFSEEQVAEYDEFVTNTPFWQGLANNVLSKWKTAWPAGSKTFLDLGCGTGRCLKHVVDAGHKAIGLDLSYAMLRAIESRTDINRDSYLLVLASATRVPLVAHSVDAVTCFGTLHHVSSPETALAEVSRVLKTGGVFQALETNDSPFRAMFDLAMKLIPLWEEEAGEHQIISSKKITSWTTNLPMSWNFDYSIFFMPHMLYMLKSVPLVTNIIKLLDFPGQIPFIRKAGGILLIEGRRLK